MSLEDFKQERIILFLGQIEVRLEKVKLKNDGRQGGEEGRYYPKWEPMRPEVGQW